MRYNNILFLGVLALFCVIPGALYAASSDIVTIDDPLVKQWAFDDIGIYHAWERTTGSRDVVVAVIDNGFDTYHPDLFDNVWVNEDEIPNNRKDDDNNGYIDDVWGWNFVPEDTDGNGTISAAEEGGNNNPRPRRAVFEELNSKEPTGHHGTAVAGLIGAVGGNGIGMSGVSPRVSLMNIRLVDESGSGSFAHLAEAIRYAVDNGADIINMSLVGPSTSNVEDAIEYAYEKGVAVFAAAGNNFRDLDASPMDPVCADATSTIELILGVSAMDESHRLSYFSNTGASCIDITAPGSDMFSTSFYDTQYDETAFLQGWDGTSFGTPLVSGVAALIKSIRPEWGPAELYRALISTVHHTPGQDETEYAKIFGNGLLDADRAIRFAEGRTADDVVLFSNSAPVKQHILLRSGVSSTTVTIPDGVEDMVSFWHNGARAYASVSKVENGNVTVTRYDEAGRAVFAFVMQTDGPVSLQVLEDQEPRFIIAPAYTSETLYWVYTTDGIMLRAYTLDHAHTGVALDTLLGRGFVTVASDETGDGTVRAFLDIFGEPYASFFVPDIGSGNSIAAFDYNDDGIDEVAIGGGAGLPYMWYYTMEGQQLRKFFAYGSYTGGFSIESLDYDEDQKDDILMVPHHTAAPLRVWSGKGRTLHEQTLSMGDAKDIRTFVRYQ